MSKIHIHIGGKTKDVNVQPSTVAEAIRKAEQILQVLRSPNINNMERDDFREGVKGLNTAYNWFK